MRPLQSAREFLERSNYTWATNVPEIRNELFPVLAGELKDKEFDVLVGTGISGIAGATLLGFLLDKPVAYVRKYGDGSHSNETYEGPRGGRVVLVDDFSDSGGTMDKVRKAVENNGGRLVGCAFYQRSTEELERYTDYPRFAGLFLAGIPGTQQDRWDITERAKLNPEVSNL